MKKEYDEDGWGWMGIYLRRRRDLINKIKFSMLTGKYNIQLFTLHHSFNVFRISYCKIGCIGFS